jgi:hypothetical protein
VLYSSPTASLIVVLPWLHPMEIKDYIATAASVAGVLGLWAWLGPLLKKQREKNSLEKDLRVIKSQVNKHTENHEMIPINLSERCENVISRSQVSAFWDVVVDAKETLKGIVDSQLKVVASKRETDEKAKLYELQDICEWARGTAAEFRFKKEEDTATELAALVGGKLRYKIRLFFILGDKSLQDRWTSFLLRQNQIQQIFQFELGYLGGYENNTFVSSFRETREHLNSIATVSLRQFIKEHEEVLSRFELPTYNKENKYKINEKDIIRIVVTEKQLPKKYYLWGHFKGKEAWEDPYKPDKFWVMSLAALNEPRADADLTAEQSLVRIIQRASVLSIIPDLHHNETHGCLFDITILLQHARYFISNAYICERCRSEILKANEIPEGRRTEFLNAVQKWLQDTSAVTRDFAELKSGNSDIQQMKYTEEPKQ